MTRITPGRRAVAAAASAAAALLLLALLVPALATATPRSPFAADVQTVVKFQDYTLAVGDTAQTVVVIGGNADIAGTVKQTVVVIGGNALVKYTAEIGTDARPQDASLVVVGGRATIEPGATLHGRTVQVAGLHFGGLTRALAAGIFLRPAGVVTGWWHFVFLPIVALVVAALFPRQLVAVGHRVRQRFWPSLGWGALGLVVLALVLVVLFITIIGWVVAIPAVLVLPAVLLFCLVAVGTLFGERVLHSSDRYRSNVVLAAWIGAIALSAVQIVPVLGALVVIVALVAGFGAALTLFNEWRRGRRLAPAPTGPADGAAAWPAAEGWGPPPGWGPSPEWTPPPGSPPPPGTPPPYWGPPPPGWTPPPPGWTPPPPGWTPPPPGWTPPPGSMPPPGWTAPPGWTPPATPPEPPGQPAGATEPDGPGMPPSSPVEAEKPDETAS